ncbi:MAG: NAD-dependent epimerase/dehydratase family protein [Proteobacteria bacterium]|nr:NAD-dependent epimerase/dehydratase family protein [Pseudomonadota bacterium]MBU1595732.1 NAD-dependent epimerase/dehydratase family protein [Pseudomonadota bacterium]
MGKTCLVTGCAGFVGSHLTQKLLDMGHRVIGVDNFFSGNPLNMQAFITHERFQFHERSIAEPRLFEELFRQSGHIHAVFHLAAIVSVPYSMHHADETYDINFLSTERLLEQAEKHGASRMVFAGSAAEYGAEERMPIKESYASDDTLQLSPYGNAKYLSTRAMCQSHIGVSLRFFNIFGPRQDPSSPYSGVISKFMSQALTDAPLTIFGDGEQTRDFVYVHDVVLAYLTAAGMIGQRLLPTDAYNIGTGKAVKIVALARIVLILTDKPNAILLNIAPEECAEVGGDPVCLFYPSREGDIVHSVADVTAMTTRSDWRAETVLSVGLARTIAWYKQDMAKGR